MVDGDRPRGRSEEVSIRATAKSHADSLYEGSGSRPGREEPATVLPYADPERLGAMLAGLQPRLTAVALRITRCPDAARDVVQSGFEKAIRHGEGFEGNARVSTWLHRIVVNEALMWLRSRRRRERLQVDCGDEARAAVPDPGPDPAHLAAHRRGRAGLRRAFEGLSAADRDVLLHCAIAGRSYAEYAQRTGHHPTAIKSRAHRARLRLRARLEASETTGFDPESFFQDR